MKLYYQKHPAHRDQKHPAHRDQKHPAHRDQENPEHRDQKKPEHEDNVSARLSIPIILIPGLFGSTRNWRSFAKDLSSIADVYVIDQRNHGESPHADSQSYADMEADLIQFMDDIEADTAHIVGHSMGGKVAMCCALWHPQRVASLTVLDIAPVAYTHSHAPFLNAMLELDVTQLASRAEADRLLSTAIADKATRLFLLQSLIGSPANYSWRLNLQVLFDYMGDIIGFPIKPSELPAKSEIPTIFIRGALSNYVADEYKQRIAEYFENPSFVTIEQAGHWLHVEQASAVLAATKSFLLKST